MENTTSATTSATTSRSTSPRHFYTSCVITVIVGIWFISGIIIVVTEANHQYPPPKQHTTQQEYRPTNLDKMLMAQGNPRPHFVDTGGKTRNLVGMW